MKKTILSIAIISLTAGSLCAGTMEMMDATLAKAYGPKPVVETKKEVEKVYPVVSEEDTRLSNEFQLSDVKTSASSFLMKKKSTDCNLIAGSEATNAFCRNDFLALSGMSDKGDSEAGCLIDIVSLSKLKTANDLSETTNSILKKISASKNSISKTCSVAFFIATK